MYDKRITTHDPGLIVILIDRSFSMTEKILKTEKKSFSKDDASKWCTDHLLFQILRQCTNEITFKEYFQFAVIEYSAEVDSAIENVSLDEFPISTDKLGATGHKTLEYNFNEEGHTLGWVKSKSTYDARTNSIKAFEHASMIIKKWITNHMDSFPPVLIHISDGHFSYNNSGKIFPVITDIKNSSTNHGNSLICNVVITSEPISQILFPTLEEIQHDETLRAVASYTTFLDMNPFDYLHSIGVELDLSKKRYLLFVDGEIPGYFIKLLFFGGAHPGYPEDPEIF